MMSITHIHRSDSAGEPGEYRSQQGGQAGYYSLNRRYIVGQIPEAPKLFLAPS